MLKFLAYVRDIAETIILIFGTILAVLVVYGVSDDYQTPIAWITVSAIAVHGMATIISWIIRRRAVNER